MVYLRGRGHDRTLHIELEDHVSYCIEVQARWNGRRRTPLLLLHVPRLPPLIKRQTPNKTVQGSYTMFPVAHLFTWNLKLNNGQTLIELLL